MSDEVPGGGTASRSRAPAVVVAAALGILALGCHSKRDPSVLILLIDALRSDHVGCYGYDRATTPAIDALAKRGVVFTDATSPASYTRAAVPSIFASIYPSAHGVFSQRKQVEQLHDDFTTIAEALKGRGYRTAAFMPNPSLHPVFNFTQGFDLYDVDFPVSGKPLHEFHETARRIHERTLRWLRERREQPYFAYLHHRDTHSPYVPPPPYDEMFAADGTARRRLKTAEYRSRPSDVRASGSHRFLEPYVALYDGEIRYTDDKIAEFLEALSREGFLDNTLLFVTADHGESFLEHGSWAHGSGLYQELLRVPLIVVFPDGRHAGRRVNVPVQTIDIYPTILEYLGADAPGHVQGKSLLAAIDGRTDPLRPVFSEARISRSKGASVHGLMASVRIGDWKLIFSRRTNTAELYDLSKDPGERENLVDEEPERVKELLDVLAKLDVENSRHSRRSKGDQPLAPSVVNDLRSLGYVQ